MMAPCDPETMFDIHCDQCGHRYLVGSRSITTLQNTPDGPVATVRCPRGHHVTHAFHGQPALVPGRAA